jgi:16S rRNA (guanine527-N7)-methyltransferase
VGPSSGRRGELREPLPTRVEDLQPLSPVFDATLNRGLLELGIELDARGREAIDRHVQLLLAWNQAINLTAIVEPGAIAIRHVLDSLTGVDVLRERRIDRILDLGSGAGFPGIPLAIAVPLRAVRLVDATRRKASFLAAASAATGALHPQIRFEVSADRAEALARQPHERATWPAVTARAVGQLGELVELAFPLLEREGCLVAWKRGELDGELAGARRAVVALGGGSLSVLPVSIAGLGDHCLVVATRTGDVPERFPRDPAARRRRPW